MSTASAIVCAAAGLKVAKHGNRASSSSCGSADVLEALGCSLTSIVPSAVRQCLISQNFCFLFSQVYHPAMKLLAPPRRELGVKTIFNYLGPLTNPAAPSRMVVGVGFKSDGPVMAQALLLAKVQRAWVVHGEIGLDEISPQGSTLVWDVKPDGSITEFSISPKDFGLPEHQLDTVRGGNAEYNANLFKQLLLDQLKGPIYDFVLMNSAALLLVSGKCQTLPEGVEIARACIQSKAAYNELIKFRDFSNSFK